MPKAVLTVLPLSKIVQKQGTLLKTFNLPLASLSLSPHQLGTLWYGVTVGSKQLLISYYIL